MRRFVVLFALSIAAGCGAKPPASNQFMPIADVAPELVTVAQETLPNVTFDSARKFKYQGEDAFEIRGKQPNGKIREVEVTAAGKVIEVE
jgi:hypothetical protein